MNENEGTLSPIEALSAKFTKANMYAVLVDFAKEDTTITMEDIFAAVKPQKGGGASANPSKEIDGVMHHWCRFKEEYITEDLMNMSGGKSKGSSKLASKVAYRIEKAAAELNADAMAQFIAGNIPEANAIVAQEKEVKALLETKETFTDEAMANSIYHPDFGKDVASEDANTAEQAEVL